MGAKSAVAAPDDVERVTIPVRAADRTAAEALEGLDWTSVRTVVLRNCGLARGNGIERLCDAICSPSTVLESIDLGDNVGIADDEACALATAMRNSARLVSWRLRVHVGRCSWSLLQLFCFRRSTLG